MSPTIRRAALSGTARKSACIRMTSTIDVSSMTSRSQSTETAGAAYLSPSAHHPHRSVNTRTPWGQDFAACAVNRSTASAGTLTCGTAVPTRMPSDIVLVWSPGSSGCAKYTLRRLRSRRCAQSGAGCGKMPRLTIASRCSGSGANTETRLGRDCSIFGDCPTFR
jgi:hypothetical protein